MWIVEKVYGYRSTLKIQLWEVTNVWKIVQHHGDIGYHILVKNGVLLGACIQMVQLYAW